MAETAYIEPDVAEELYESSDGDTVLLWTRVTDERGDTGRWVEHHTLIIRNTDGSTWGLHYERGLTEYQDSRFPWRDGGAEPVALTRLYPHTVTKTVYRTAPPDDPMFKVGAMPHGLDPGQVC